jgi:hypothetical protein
MSTGAWMRANLTAQGYCLSDAERRELAVGLRFSTGVCLGLVVVALVLASPVMVFALSGIGLVAGFGARHPFDHVWNHGVRRLVGGPALPPTPPRRRDAFKVGTAWLHRRDAPGRGRDDSRAVARRSARRGLRHRDRHEPLPAIRDVRLARAPPNT